MAEKLAPEERKDTAKLVILSRHLKVNCRVNDTVLKAQYDQLANAANFKLVTFSTIMRAL